MSSARKPEHKPKFTLVTSSAVIIATKIGNYYTHLYFAKRQQKKTIKAKNKKKHNNKKPTVTEQRI